MTVGLSTTVRNNMLTQLLNAIDLGATGGLIRIYDGTRPATGGAATTKLAELTCAATSGSVAAGVLTFAAITQDTTADATGTATWARIVDSDGTFVLDCSVTATGGGGDITLNTVSIVASAIVAITNFGTITAGNA